jgi:hypothetical protein
LTTPRAKIRSFGPFRCDSGTRQIACSRTYIRWRRDRLFRAAQMRRAWPQVNPALDPVPPR